MGSIVVVITGAIIVVVLLVLIWSLCSVSAESDRRMEDFRE